MVARRTAKDTAALIEEVARGDRLLEDIADPELRETVRLALRLHKDPFTAPDASTRSRIRSRVLRTLNPRGESAGDRLALVFELLAKPTPYAMRAFAMTIMFAFIVGGAAVASAGAVAPDPLYPVKTTSEQVRLALATTPEDRAIVWLSIAEHRLAEAAALAAAGNEHDAIVASGAYGEHMANAAAELAQVEQLEPATATLVTQLQARIEEHRASTAAVVAKLSENPTTAPAAAVLAVLAARASPEADLSPAAAIAAQAASAADGVAAVAERGLGSARRDDDDDDDPARAVATRPSATAEAGRDSSYREGPSRKERAAESARKSAEEARAAAKKAKASSKRTPTPTPRRR